MGNIKLAEAGLTRVRCASKTEGEGPKEALDSAPLPFRRPSPSVSSVSGVNLHNIFQYLLFKISIFQLQLTFHILGILRGNIKLAEVGLTRVRHASKTEGEGPKEALDSAPLPFLRDRRSGQIEIFIV